MSKRIILTISEKMYENLSMLAKKLNLTELEYLKYLITKAIEKSIKDDSGDK